MKEVSGNMMSIVNSPAIPFQWRTIGAQVKPGRISFAQYCDTDYCPLLAIISEEKKMCINPGPGLGQANTRTLQTLPSWILPSTSQWLCFIAVGAKVGPAYSPSNSHPCVTEGWISEGPIRSSSLTSRFHCWKKLSSREVKETPRGHTQ